ncbi:hypothetical protein LINGRAHAP2_LOCUS14247 [Linum grandiflorum]
MTEAFWPPMFVSSYHHSSTLTEQASSSVVVLGSVSCFRKVWLPFCWSWIPRAARMVGLC